MMDETAETAAMRRDVDEMQAMLDAFLAYARADAENPALEAVEPAALAREVMDEATRAGMRVTEWQIEEGGLIRLSPLAVKRALMNLIGNADRYAGGGQVSVSLRDDGVEMIIEDSGPGIPADQRDAAIRPFERLDQSRNQDRGAGTGLGLAIASDVMSRHGGRLVLSDSERLGGLRASLILPR
jgi:two-component system osmolarity sensor histidine kinase EnvZ